MMELEYRTYYPGGSPSGGVCDCCGESFPVVIYLGEVPDHESHDASVCENCLQKALELLRNAKEGK